MMTEGNEDRLMNDSFSDSQEQQEVIRTTGYEYTKLNRDDPTRCIDGRPSGNPRFGPQMLGGYLHGVVLHAVVEGKKLDDAFLVKDSQVLMAEGYKQGIHTADAHGHKDASGCGFADNLPLIIQTVYDRGKQIAELLSEWHEQHEEELANRGKEKEYADFTNFKEDLLKALDFFKGHVNKYTKEGKYDGVSKKGAALMQVCKDQKASEEKLIGEHQEKAAVVNLDPETTFNNQSSVCVFNLDLHHAVEQTLALTGEAAVTKGLVTAASMLLYVATEIVLVEQKGKERLPLEIHRPSGLRDAA